jgi:hypothetical protein
VKRVPHSLLEMATFLFGKWSGPRSNDRAKISSNSPGSKDHLVRKRSPVRIRAWAPSPSKRLDSVFISKRLEGAGRLKFWAVSSGLHSSWNPPENGSGDRGHGRHLARRWVLGSNPGVGSTTLDGLVTSVSGRRGAAADQLVAPSCAAPTPDAFLIAQLAFDFTLDIPRAVDVLRYCPTGSYPEAFRELSSHKSLALSDFLCIYIQFLGCGRNRQS